MRHRLTGLEFLQMIVIVLMFFCTVYLAAERDELVEDNKRLKARLAEAQENPFVLVIDEPKKTEATAANTATPTVKAAANANTRTDDVDLLARLIMCEMGSDGHPDRQLYNVGSVVINRVNDPRFPNTIREVIYAPGQYASAISGEIETEKPTQRCYDIASDLIVNGSRLPADVVWQSEAPQGTEIVETFRSSVMGTTTYYCR